MQLQSDVKLTSLYHWRWQSRIIQLKSCCTRSTLVILPRESDEGLKVWRKKKRKQNKKKSINQRLGCVYFATALCLINRKDRFSVSRSWNLIPVWLTAVIESRCLVPCAHALNSFVGIWTLWWWAATCIDWQGSFFPTQFPFVIRVLAGGNSNAGVAFRMKNRHRQRTRETTRTNAQFYYFPENFN